MRRHAGALVVGAAAIFGFVAGALMRRDASVPVRDTSLPLEQVYPIELRTAWAANASLLGESTRDDPARAARWEEVYTALAPLPCAPRPGHAVGPVWVAPGDLCFLASRVPTSALGRRFARACDGDAGFANDYTLESHVLSCVEMKEYDALRTTGHCYEPPLLAKNGTIGLRITDEQLRSVCVLPAFVVPLIWFGGLGGVAVAYGKIVDAIINYA